MEDSHAHILSLGDLDDQGKKTSFFAVYDGHGGSSVARFAGDTVHHRLAANDHFKKRDYEAALKRAFLETDEDLRARGVLSGIRLGWYTYMLVFLGSADPDFRGDPSGCTAVAALITSDLKIICVSLIPQPTLSPYFILAIFTSRIGADNLFCKLLLLYVNTRPTSQANAGDSRSVLSVGGVAKPMSFDHKPTNTGENARIVAGGGFVEFGRVNGNLALSRALGDFEFKQSPQLDAEHQVVTADPDINIHEHTPEDEFLVIACDGIWDVLSSQQTIDYVRRGIAQRKELSVICEELMTSCLAPDSDWGGVGCDNMTVLLVAILGDRTKAEWQDWVASRYEQNIGYSTPRDFVDPFAQGPRGGAAKGPPGSLSMALGGGGPNGESESEGESEGEEDESANASTSASALKTIQDALRAQGINIEGLGDTDRDEKLEGETPKEEPAPTLTQTPPPI
ncbi:protein phosphatase PTC2/3, partial [Phenoliferia sp. Uapishka_3]